jgi:hypothetical protein
MFTINENCLNSNKCDESNFYKYTGLDKLYKLDDTLKSNSKIDNFYICGYRVNNNELYPFLDFLLKNIQWKQLSDIMSPGKKAVEFSKLLPPIFSF